MTRTTLTSWPRSHRCSLALQQRTKHRGYGRHICSSFTVSASDEKTMDCLVARVRCSGPNLILRARQMSHCPHEPRRVCSWISAPSHTARRKERRIYAQRGTSSASSSRAARWWTASSGGRGHPSLALGRMRRCQRGYMLTEHGGKSPFISTIYIGQVKLAVAC